MRALSKTRLQDALTKRLGLKGPQFVLRSYGGMLCGSVISESFSRKGDLQRVRMIRGALAAELGPEGERAVGTLLAYTPEEWDIDLGPDLMSVAKEGNGRNGASASRSTRARRSGRHRREGARNAR